MRRMIAVIVVVIFAVGCGSSGNANPQPSITGAAGSADDTICSYATTSDPFNSVTAAAESNASPDLVSLFDEWKTDYGAAQMGVDGADAKTIAAAAAVGSWCSSNGFGQ